MKILVAFATVLFTTSLLSAQTQPAAKTTTTPVAKKDVKNTEPEPKIPGQTIPRSNGTFLGLEAIDANFKLSFYDKEKKPMAPDVSRATVRWPNKRGPGDLRAVLNPGDKALVGGLKRVDPPYTYNVYLALLQGEGDDATVVENFVVPFHG